MRVIHNNRVKVVTFAVVLVAWFAAMAQVMFVQRATPDPLMWGIPAGAYTILWPPSRRDDQAE